MLLARGSLEADSVQSHVFNMDDVFVILLVDWEFRDKGHIL